MLDALFRRLLRSGMCLKRKTWPVAQEKEPDSLFRWAIPRLTPIPDICFPFRTKSPQSADAVAFFESCPLATRPVKFRSSH